MSNMQFLDFSLTNSTTTIKIGVIFRDGSCYKENILSGMKKGHSKHGNLNLELIKKIKEG